MAWTKARLEDVARTRLNGARLLVVANREPYIHQYRDGEIEWIRPAGGLTTALDPVMRACGGTWVAHGSGDADRDATGPDGRVGVPPDDPTYVLRRVWLSKEEEEGYYYGFANSTLWPMCHQVYQRPTFDADHWRAYRDVNRKFADAVLEEAADGPTLVFVQDYHFALLPRMLKDARPDLVVAQFWHIPWPHPETFQVCPWAAELLAGMLGNDLLSFQTQHHCNNFLDTVDRTMECRIERDRFAAVCGGRDTLVRPYPISVDPDLADEYLGPAWERKAAGLRRRYRLGDRPLLVGVDRVDYTKGIPERLAAVERLLETHPEWKGKFHFVQVGAPSRTHLSAYRDLNDQVQEMADRINWRHGSAGWQPIVFLNEHLGPETVFLLYRIAAGCVVSSLHDGMNLVAKEFVTARGDDRGVLVLSKFTGAARELTDAVLVNPMDADGLADGLHLALTMPAAEQERRMRRMRAQVADHNIYRWAGMLLSEAARLAGSVPVPERSGEQSPTDDFESLTRIGASAWAIST
jgi:trehalose 6-phosphate synthase